MDKLIRLPLISLRGLVVFPGSMVSFDIDRLRSADITMLEAAAASGNDVFLITHKSMETEGVTGEALFNIGTVSKIKRVMPSGAGSMRVLATGQKKARLLNVGSVAGVAEAVLELYDENTLAPLTLQVEALMASVREAYNQHSMINPKIVPEMGGYIEHCYNPYELSNYVAGSLNIPFDQKQELLELDEPEAKLTKTLEHLLHQIELVKIQNDIHNKVRVNIEKAQREHYLREQIKVINEELGDKAGPLGDIDEFKEKIDSKKLPDHVREKVEKELSRLRKSSGHTHEAVVIRDYIEWVLDLPWCDKSDEVFDLKGASDILEADHYGLREVKDRVLEFLAVRKNTDNEYSPILCLLGPPGVGKTSVVKSIASALGRKYVRMSLGGVKDESEIRGHRRTYIGSMPGRIIYSLRQAKTNNPVILLDEIDKLSSDVKGDPSSALLEVLDSEQNMHFRDHYLEVPFDLSDVCFVCTANDATTIPPALRDRMEIIELASYTLVEKQHIAQSFLLPKQIKKHGMGEGSLKISAACVSAMIEFYTKEAGVRQLERLIAKVCRKVVKKNLLLGASSLPTALAPEDLEEYLGAKKFKSSEKAVIESAGVAIGLAWTRYGGDILPIEVNSFVGKGKLELTGSMGDIMKESAKAAMSFIRANAETLGIDAGFYTDKDLHIHIPEGATPKDGPSAGISMCLAIISRLSGKVVADNVAMSGEITIRGNVLPVGGLKEKILAAKMKGIEKVILPHANIGDVADIDYEIKGDINIVFVKTMDEVMSHAFGDNK